MSKEGSDQGGRSGPCPFPIRIMAMAMLRGRYLAQPLECLSLSARCLGRDRLERAFGYALEQAHKLLKPPVGENENVAWFA